MRFTLSIELGNTAMSEGPDVAAALRSVADRLEQSSGILDAEGGIRDGNGNTVGKYEVSA